MRNRDLLQDVIDDCLGCVKACRMCADNCSGISGMEKCVSYCLECEDQCRKCAIACQHDAPSKFNLMQACAEICDCCAKECEKFDNDYSRRCAEACRTCSETCMSLVA